MPVTGLYHTWFDRIRQLCSNARKSLVHNAVEERLVLALHHAHRDLDQGGGLNLERLT
jgi:hypothetical protein